MRRVRVGVIDSGVYAAHSHVGGVAGGVGITREGAEEPDYTDRLGHGTAVTAAIREKAPDADVYAVKIFHERLAAPVAALEGALEWCVRNGMDAINLSLGTSNPAHEERLRPAVARIVAAGIVLVAAAESDGVRWLPGAMEGVVPVALDWECPRDSYRVERAADGRRLYRASGYPRPIPGVPPERNLKGVSFAVANVTGLLAREMAASGGAILAAS